MKYREILLKTATPCDFLWPFSVCWSRQRKLQFVSWLADKKRNYGLTYLCCREMFSSGLDSLYTITVLCKFNSALKMTVSPILRVVLPMFFFSDTTIQYNTIPPYLFGSPVVKPAYIQAPPYISMVYFKSRFCQHNRHVGGKVDSFSCLPGVRFIFGRIPSEKLYKNNNPLSCNGYISSPSVLV
jgi:hypothetical protein